jgi:hypothetical protein
MLYVQFTEQFQYVAVNSLLDCNSQGGVSLKYHSFVEFAFDERNLGDLGLRI